MERVLVDGRTGVFVVSWVDQERQEADLMPAHLGLFVEETVVFSRLRPWRENIPL
jgi:hypothetical protein